jgi:Tol biopolymer transport system component
VPEGHRSADPSWYPDGSSLLFCSQPYGEGPVSGTLDLETVDLRTQAVSKVSGSEELWSPRWSRDGRYILALSRAIDRIMLFDVNTQKWTELAKLGVGYPIALVGAPGPEWSRHGDYVYFYGAPSAAGQAGGIFRLRIRDRKLEQLGSLKDFRQAGAAWMGLAPDDSPLLVRDAGSQDIYALDWDAP